MRLPTSRIRWDRKLRVIMLGVFALVGWVGIHAAMTMLATRAQASAEQSLVNRLTRENASLERQATELNQTGTIIRDARALGMVRVGERAYVVTPGG
jgi:cell division protein FtsB